MNSVLIAYDKLVNLIETAQNYYLTTKENRSVIHDENIFNQNQKLLIKLLNDEISSTKQFTADALRYITIGREDLFQTLQQIYSIELNDFK